MSTPSTNKTDAYFQVKKLLIDISTQPFVMVLPPHHNFKGSKKQFLQQVKRQALYGSLEMSYRSNCGITEAEYDELYAWIGQVVPSE